MEQFKLTAKSHVEEPKGKRGRPSRSNKDEVMSSPIPASLANHTLILDNEARHYYLPLKKRFNEKPQPKGKRGRPAEPKNNEQQKEGTNNNIVETKTKQIDEDTEDSSYSGSLSNQSDSWECPNSQRKRLIPASMMVSSRGASLRSSKKITEHHQTESPIEHSSAIVVYQQLDNPVDTTNNCANQALSLTPKQAEKVGNSDVNIIEKSIIAVVDTLGVKPELMDILRKIVTVHGDIVQNSTISTIKYRSMYLEVIGDMIIELQEKFFAETDDDRLQDMMIILDDMKRKKVDVEWLQQKLVEIVEARQVFKHSMMLKEKRECNIKFIENVEQELKEKEEEIEAMKAKLQSLHDEKIVCKKKLDSAREECSNITKSIEDDNAKMKSFQNFSLVDDLYLV